MSPTVNDGTKPVPPYKAVIAVADQVPELIVPTLLSDDAVVKDANDVTAVFTKVPDVGNVTLVGPVVVTVKLFAPEVTSEEPSARVNVADDPGAVIVTLLYVLALTVLFARITPDIDDEKPVPVNKLPPIPTPPETIRAPDVVLVETVVFVIDVVPPINAFPVTPNPPKTLNAATVVDVAFVAPRIVTPVPTAVIRFVELTDAPVPA